MAGSLHAQAFDPWVLLLDYQNRQVKGMGATSVFVGTMRDYNEGDDVASMSHNTFSVMPG